MKAWHVTDRSGVISEHAGLFAFVERTTARQQQRLPRERLLDVLRGTYRAERRSAAERVNALDSLDTTFASDVLVFRRG